MVHMYIHRWVYWCIVSAGVHCIVLVEHEGVVRGKRIPFVSGLSYVLLDFHFSSPVKNYHTNEYSSK